LGFALAFTTVVLWALLPIALEALLVRLDAFTITWARFVVSTGVLGAWLAIRGGLAGLVTVGARDGWLLAGATAFLAVNYGTFIVGLDWTSPADAQILIQLGPILLGLGGIFVFRERFTRLQWIGFAVLAIGLLVFLAGRRVVIEGATPPSSGGWALIGVAALTWAVYGLAQKQLLQRFASNQVLLAIYVGCALAFTPLAAPSSLVGLGATELALLGFCALNTVVGYGSFAESLAHLEASKVGAVIALTPLLTLGIKEAVDALWPAATAPQTLSAESWLGALLVVAGCLATSLAAGE
jgi:drug/metabolite transporter (DMT)-like permease